MFKAVYGAAEYDSGAYLFEKLSENTEGGIKSYVLVPEQFSVFTERRVISALGTGAQRKIEVLTFSRLSNLVLSSLGPLRMKYIDGAGKEILASRTMQLIEKKLEYFRPNVHQRGFSALMAELVSEFKRYGHTPDALRAAAESVADDEGVSELPRKLKDLALFYEVYGNLINKNNSDAEDNLSIILPKIKDFEIPNGSRLYITEFRSFTPLERDVLIELMKKASSAELILRCDNPDKADDLFRFAAAAYRELKSAAEQAGISVAPPEPIQTKRELEPDIEHMIKNYFKIRPEKYKSEPKHVHLMRPGSYFEELETAAKIIHRLCRTRGLKQSDFLILARDTDEYAGIMPLVFESSGINVFLDKRRSLTENPYLRHLSSALCILARGFSYERIMDMARSGFCLGLSDDDCDIFENYLLAVNPSHAMLNSGKDWTVSPAGSAYDLEMINRVKRALLDPVSKIKKSIKGRKTAGEIAEAVFKFMDEQKHSETMRRICKSFSDQGFIYLAEEYRRSWNSVVSILSEIGEIMNDVYMTYDKFYDLFTSACASIKVGVSPQTIDGAVFSRVDMFRSAGVRVVILLGATDGVFPKSRGSEGLISDRERLILRGAGLSMAMTAAEKSIDENMLIYNVLSAASDEIYILSPQSSGSETLEPSPIVTKLMNDVFDISYEELSKKPETQNEALSMLKTKIAAERFDGFYRLLYKYFCNDESLKLFSARNRSAKSGYEKLTEKAVEELYGRDIMLSASRLEKFNNCAFAYFMRYGLAAMPRDIARFDPLSMGNILHETLEKYFSGKIEFEKITKEQCRRDVGAIVEELAAGADEVMYQSSAYYKYLCLRMSGIASTTAWETIKFFRVSEFRPLGFEVRIGSGGVPPIRIETRNGSVRVEGFIDRVDGAEVDGTKYISIVDYKSSVHYLDPKLAEAGVTFQPLVYMKSLLNGGGAEPAAMLYQQMNDPIIDAKKAATESDYENAVHGGVKAEGWVIDDEKTLDAFDKKHNVKKEYYINPRNAIPMDEMKKRLEKAEQKIAESAEGILDGKISAAPYLRYGNNPCKYCDYSGICNAIG